MAKSLVAGAKVTEVAKRHGVRANMVSAWRVQALAQSNTTGNEQNDAPISTASLFVPVRVAGAAGRQTDVRADALPAAGGIEIVLADPTIRVAKEVDTATLSRVLAAVRDGRR